MADACEAPVDFPPCPPGEVCPPCEGGTYAGCCYQQPPRRLPIKPQVSFLQSTAPLETDTIYRRSYYGNTGNIERPRPVRPDNSIVANTAPMEKCTVHKLSYMPPCQASRTAPVLPLQSGLRFEGPIYAMTSQKHDYVPKGFVKRAPILPKVAICCPPAPIERCTIQKLSYMPIDITQNRPPKPMSHETQYIKPEGPMEHCTIHKLSYMPVCLQPKEPTPWADKVRCAPPDYQNICTTYNLSYMPNIAKKRPIAVVPTNTLRFMGNDAGASSTIYKLSYRPVDVACARPAPVRPVDTFRRSTGPVEKCTVHKLSYQPNCAERTAPVRPMENGLRFDGPLYAMTTHKHDYVPMPVSRRAPMAPLTAFCQPTGPVERCTVNKLSYMPVDVTNFPRPVPVKPREGFCRTDGPVESCTTYKLSYLPNCVQPKEPCPWARSTTYCRSTAPSEKCTIQKLSYGPPGAFKRCGGPCSCAPVESGSCPKAGIC